LPTLDNSSVNLSDFENKVIYLDFWASWCGPCKESLPWLQNMQYKYASRGLQVLLVNVDTEKSAASELLRKLNVTLMTLLDPGGRIAEAFGLKTMPSSFLISRGGKVALVHSGFSKSDRDALENAILALL